MRPMPVSILKLIRAGPQSALDARGDPEVLGLHEVEEEVEHRAVERTLVVGGDLLEGEQSPLNRRQRLDTLDQSL